MLADRISPCRFETPETVIVALMFSHVPLEIRLSVRSDGTAPGSAFIKASVKPDDSLSSDAMFIVLVWVGS